MDNFSGTLEWICAGAKKVRWQEVFTCVGARVSVSRSVAACWGGDRVLNKC